MKQSHILIVLILTLLSSCEKEKNDEPTVTFFDLKNGLPNNYVYCIEEDNNGNIWVGTENGIGKLEENKWQIYFDTINLQNKRVKNITTDNSGNIWFEFLSDKNNLYKFNGLKLEKIDSFELLYNNLNTSESYYYSKNIIYKYQNNGFKEIEIPLVAGDKCGIYDILIDKNENFWISMNDYCLKGISKYDGVNWTDYKPREIFKNKNIGNNIYGIIERDNGNILFSAGSSILEINGTDLHIFLDLSVVPNELIVTYEIFEDSDNNLWFGFDKLYKYNGTKILNIDISVFPETGKYSRTINTIFEDSKENIWIGTGDGLIMIK